MKVLVTGSAGLVGSRFVELAPKTYDLLTPEIDSLDLTDFDKVENYISKERPDVVIHFAAYTDVDGAEKQKGDKSGLAWRVNVGGTKNLVSAVEKIDCRIVHISTDFIFPGDDKYPGPYTEDARLPEDNQAISWYGWTKLQAEKEVLNSGAKAAIVRISYPFRSEYPTKADFARNILNLFDSGNLYPMFADQKVTPTFIDDACRLITVIIKSKKEGIFHAASCDLTTPYLFASYLIKKARGVEGVVKKGSMKEFFASGDKTPRHRLGGLKSQITQRQLGIDLMSWKDGIDEMVKQRNS